MDLMSLWSIENQRLVTKNLKKKQQQQHWVIHQSPWYSHVTLVSDYSFLTAVIIEHHTNVQYQVKHFHCVCLGLSRYGISHLLKIIKVRHKDIQCTRRQTILSQPKISWMHRQPNCKTHGALWHAQGLLLIWFKSEKSLFQGTTSRPK